MSYSKIYNLFKLILNKLTLPGLSLVLFITLLSVYHSGIAEIFLVRTLITITFANLIPILTIFTIGILVAEGVFSHTYMPYMLFRRRIDIENSIWESFEAFLLYYDEDEVVDFFEYHNGLFSSDGFCPRSYAEMDTVYEDNMRSRMESVLQISEFFRFVAPRMGRFLDYENYRSLTFPTPRNQEQFRNYYGNNVHPDRKRLNDISQIIKARVRPGEPFHIETFANFTPPNYYKNLFSIDQNTDFSELGVSLVSGSAVDSCSYIYDIEQPEFFSLNSLNNIMSAYDPNVKLTVSFRKGQFFGLTSLGSFSEHMQTPDTLSYTNKFEYLEEYPVNLGQFFVKRDWEENPDAITFRDPFTGVYSNLTRLSLCSIELDTDVLRKEFFFYHKIPRKTQISLKKNQFNISPNTEFVRRNCAFAINDSNTLVLTRILTPEFTRFGWLSHYYSILRKGLLYYLSMDRERAFKLYSGFPGELEILPTGILFSFANFNLLLKRRFYTLKNRILLIKEQRTKEKQLNDTIKFMNKRNAKNNAALNDEIIKLSLLKRLEHIQYEEYTGSLVYFLYKKFVALLRIIIERICAEAQFRRKEFDVILQPIKAEFSTKFPLAWFMFTEILMLIKVVLYIYYKIGESIVDELYTYAYKKTPIAKTRAEVGRVYAYMKKKFFMPDTIISKYITITNVAPPLIQEPLLNIIRNFSYLPHREKQKYTTIL